MLPERERERERREVLGMTFASMVIVEPSAPDAERFTVVVVSVLWFVGVPWRRFAGRATDSSFPWEEANAANDAITVVVDFFHLLVFLLSSS